MKKLIYGLTLAATLAMMQSCSKEAPFSGTDEGTGKLLTKGLSLEVNSEEILSSKADNTPSAADFDVDFISGDKVVATYRYSDMPEVVTLPAGSYTAVAHHGKNVDAAFNSPYYEGTSEQFTIARDVITEIKDPVVCSLANVKVTILFDTSLASVMSADSKVTVKVGDSGTLDFTKNTQESGYFAYVADSKSLAATFTGNVQGEDVNETKIYTEAKRGCHYRITFRLHAASAEGDGFIAPGTGFVVDAGVTVADMTGDGSGNFNPDEETLPDDMRPSENGDNEPENPGDDTSEGPVVYASTGIKLSDGDKQADFIQNQASKLGGTCILYVKSETGLTDFSVKIISNKLDPDELSTMGLAQEFNLCTIDITTPMAESLGNLGFLPTVEDEEGDKVVTGNYAGCTDLITLDISGFLSLLQALGKDEVHSFVLYTKDASGETVKTMTLVMN